MDRERKRPISLDGTDKTQGEMVTMYVVGDVEGHASDGTRQPRKGHLRVLDGNFHDAGMERGADDDLMEDLMAAIHDFVETASEEELASFNLLTAAMERVLEDLEKWLDAVDEAEKRCQYEAFYLGFEQMLESALADDVDEIFAGLDRILAYFDEECCFKNRDAFNQYFDSKDRKPFAL
ncbi:hypothetical protein [uncultured Megasphaera sp.]|uniref:hypothetical protein n=1 Tax=uncultured Megasphaera sp. TaxID=165188 RepID=UPI0025F50FAB|nr:hypothetical protein [uncultured Megasphaera sp.]